MKAPIDKLQAGGNKILQIIVCHACDKACSNCTQAVTYKRRGYTMSVPVFRQAIESLRGWADAGGVVGMFGGNPALHPNFDELCAIMREVLPDQRSRGLWCNHPRGKGKTIRDTFYPFGYFNLNCHGDAGAAAEFDEWVPGKLIRSSDPRSPNYRDAWHASIFTAIQDYVGTPEIPDEAAMRARIERCPINLDWSGAIAERNGQARGYFCELTAMFDILYDRDSGVPVAPGWWQQGMDAFAHQHRQCGQCGVSLNLKGQKDHTDTDDYSATHAGLVQLNVRRKGNRIDELPTARAPRATDYERLRTVEEVRAQ